MATPRTCGRCPSQRLRPALPIDTFSWSILPTWPIVAKHSMLILRISPDGIFTDAYSPSRATSCTEEPALRAIWPPLPGFSSTWWICVPSGMFFSGRQLPGRMSTMAPETLVSPTYSPAGGRRHGFSGAPVARKGGHRGARERAGAHLDAERLQDVALLAVRVRQQRDARRAVRVVRDGRDLRRDVRLVALEVDHP